MLKNDFKIGDLPLEVQYWVTISKEDYLNQKDIDRSELLYRLASKLIKNNFSAEDIFGILEGTLFNKFKNKIHFIHLRNIKIEKDKKSF